MGGRERLIGTCAGWGGRDGDTRAPVAGREGGAEHTTERKRIALPARRNERAVFHKKPKNQFYLKRSLHPGARKRHDPRENYRTQKRASFPAIQRKRRVPLRAATAPAAAS